MRAYLREVVDALIVDVKKLTAKTPREMTKSE
jgi:hypothetical protein